MNKNLTIGLFGFGVVGQGLYDIISSRNLNVTIKKIVIKDPSKKRSLPEELFTTDGNAVLDDPEIDTIVELINDADAAYYIVTKALKNGKNVVSANKRMIANHLAELVELQSRYGTSLLYEGAVCGSIPIIRNLEEYYDNELLYSIRGIFNGSSNYILSKIFNENLDYTSALSEAQLLGFAETDPLLDVGGFDAKYKLSIATAHAHGVFIHPDEILNMGIQHLSAKDIQYAREKDRRIKLVPVAFKTPGNKVVLYVLPKFIDKNDFLYNVENEYNGVIVQAAFADQQFFFGKGAGGHPTGSAVLSDIAALRYSYQYEYKKHHLNDIQQETNFMLKVYLRYTDDALIQKLEFDEITEQFNTRDFKYVIGNISLDNLRKHADEICSPGNFLVETGDHSFNVQPVQSSSLAETAV